MKKTTLARIITAHEKLEIFEGSRCVIVFSTFNPPLICKRSHWDATNGDAFERTRYCRKKELTPYQYISLGMWERLLAHGLSDRNTVTFPYSLQDAVTDQDFDEQRIVYWDSKYDFVFQIGHDIPMSLPVVSQLSDTHYDIDRARAQLLQSEWIIDCPPPYIHAGHKVLAFTSRLPDPLFRKLVETFQLLEPSNWRQIVQGMYVWSPALRRFSSHNMDFFGLQTSYKGGGS